MRTPVYLDYAATTPVDDKVAAAMTDCLRYEGNFGNPASRSHAYGWQAEEAVEHARTQVAALINADPREIVFTSGATESDNLALKGTAEDSTRGHIITSQIEHKAVLDTCAYLETKGCEVTYLKPTTMGLITPQAVVETLRPDTLIASIMHANNELGVVNDIAAMAKACRDNGTYFHTDAAQSAGKIPLDVVAMDLDLVSISGHKIYGPKGIGALYVRRQPPVRLQPIIHGGGHEFGMRSGTLPTHLIVGLGAAAEIMAEKMAEEGDRLTRLRERLLAHFRQIPGSHLHGDATQRLPGIVNVGFEDVDGETLLLALDDLAVSSGSACTSASVEPSFVLQALDVDAALAHASIRFSLGRYTTEAEVDYAGKRVAEVVAGLRSAA